MNTHDLKCHPDFWDAVETGEKTFEVRKNDRGYEVGDRLNLYRYDAMAGYPAGYFEENKSDFQKLTFDIGFILPGGQFGIAADYCVLALAPQNPENF